MSSGKVQLHSKATHPDPGLQLLEKYEFIAMLIIGIAALTVIGFGLGGYFKGICHLNQVNSLIVIASGAGAAALMLVIAGIVKSVRLCLKVSTHSNPVSSIPSPFHSSSIRQELPNLKIYGAKEWQALGIDVKDEPELSSFIYNQLAEKEPSHVLFLIPTDLNVSQLVEVARKRGLILNIDNEIIKKMKKVECRESYWLLISKSIVAGCKGQSFDEQATELSRFDTAMPHFIEFLAFVIMHSSELQEHEWIGSFFYCDGTFFGGKHIVCAYDQKTFKASFSENAGQSGGTLAVIKTGSSHFVFKFEFISP